MLIAWAASLSASVYYTADYVKAKATEDKLEAIGRAIAQRRALDAENLKFEVAAAQARQKTKIIYREKRKGVDDYAKDFAAVKCLDTDGLRLFNATRSNIRASDERDEPMRTGTPSP